MAFGRLFGRRVVGKDEFAQWAKETPGVDPVHHYQALRACWPYLAGGRQKVLDIGPEPGPWLSTIERFAGRRHDLWACRQGGIGDAKAVPEGAHVRPAEFDVWSPLGQREAAHALDERGFTLVTALQLVDHLYHPDTLFRVLSDVMVPRGVLVLTAKNVARLSNVLGLLRGAGVAGDVDALIGRGGAGQPRPRVREYCWQELNGAALGAGFAPLGHGFYDDAADRSVAGTPDQFQAVRQVVSPFLREGAAQLQSEMVLVFRKAGPVSVRLHRVRRGVYPLLREARAKVHGVQRRLRSGPSAG